MRTWTLAALFVMAVALARGGLPWTASRPSAPVRAAEELRDAVADIPVPRASTETARAPVASLVPPPGSEAVQAGERRGMVELTATAAAPADPQSFSSQ